MKFEDVFDGWISSKPMSTKEHNEKVQKEIKERQKIIELNFRRYVQ